MLTKFLRLPFALPPSALQTYSIGSLWTNLERGYLLEKKVSPASLSGSVKAERIKPQGQEDFLEH
ncbi:MAG: hypothetical protein LAP38_03600 [Acidobacteriia bacterium]|nr:hypothetical protein [Terriglobia bacterium]